MCENLCINFGDYINDFEGHEYYTFPTPEALSKPNVEAKLRDLGFGYRAKYIYQTACKFTDNNKYPGITIENLNLLRKPSIQLRMSFYYS